MTGTLKLDLIFDSLLSKKRLCYGRRWILEKSHEIAVGQALSYMRETLSDCVSMNQISEHVGYSASYLRSVFRKATGKGPLAHLLEMRLSKAKTLLRDTRLGISQIAFESGFKTYKDFHFIFSKRAGCTPSSFRKLQGSLFGSGENRNLVKNDSKAHWFYEAFHGPKWNSVFVAKEGTWEQREDFIAGISDVRALLTFQKPLPENFRLCFDAQLVSKPGLASREVLLYLGDSQAGHYCQIALGRIGGAVSELVAGSGRQMRTDVAIDKGKWHRIQFEMRDDTIRLEIDGAEFFLYKDAFPPPFSRRSHLRLGTYNGELRIRNLAIFDLGFFPLVRNVRQGDSLFSNGIFSLAREFYMRLLASNDSIADQMELTFKVGLCFLREGDPFQARTWLEKVISTPETTFWAEMARLHLFDIEIKESHHDAIRQSYRSFLTKDSLRNGAREILDSAGNDYRSRGFFEEEIFLRQLLLENEPPGNFLSFMAAISLADALTQLRRFKPAEELFRLVVDDSAAVPLLSMTLFSLCDNCALQKRNREWSATLNQLSALVTPNTSDANRLGIYRGIYERAAGNFEGALAAFSGVEGKDPQAEYWRVFAHILGAQILAALGRAEEARNLLQRAERRSPANRHFAIGRRSWSFYPVEFNSGNFENGARILLNDAQGNSEIALGAEQAIQGGILLSLAGKDKEAVAVWKNVADRFIATRFSFYGPFADSLCEGRTNLVDDMPYPAERRSEMFFLLGCLCEKKGDTARSRALFEKCIEEDGLMHWPAIAARRRLQR